MSATGSDSAQRQDGQEHSHKTPFRALFECSPTGSLTVDGKGRILAANPAARALLGDALPPGNGHMEGEATCCEVMACGRPDTALAGTCITQLALEAAGGALPEVRVDVRLAGGETRSVWLIAAPLDAPPVKAVLQIRPGVVGDRRRRTEPHWVHGPQLRVYTLGRTSVESGECPLPGEWLAHRPGQVLKYLITQRGRPVPLDELVEVFWPGTGASASNVRQAIHTLRERLEPARRGHGHSTFIVARKGGYEIDTANVWIDADEFEAVAGAGFAAIVRGDREAAERDLLRALKMHRGDFLAEERYAEWAVAERDRLRDVTGRVLRELTDIRLEEHDLEGATDHLHRLAELQPLHLEVQEQFVRLLLRRGLHDQAARRLEVVRHRYRRTFGTDPTLRLDDPDDAAVSEPGC